MPQLEGSDYYNPLVGSGQPEAHPWSYIVVAKQRSPGIIPPGGVDGFDRETGWDKKKGKGTQGATLTLTTYPPAEGSITFQLWLPFHFIEWKRFAQLLKYRTAKQSGEAFVIEYPPFVDLEISQVVTAKISPIKFVGKGLYEVKVDLIEWIPPPPVDISATPSMASTNSGDNPGEPPDAIGDAQQRQIQGLMQEGGLSGNPVPDGPSTYHRER